MDTKELVKAVLYYEIYEMCMNFLNGLLKDKKLTETEFDKAAKYTADRYDIEAVKQKLAQSKYPNLQSESPSPEESLVYAPAKKEDDIKYISLTDIAKKFSDMAPSYVIQSWMRSRNTLEFLKLWEQRHNDRLILNEYETLMNKFNSGTFTMTPKQWIE